MMKFIEYVAWFLWGIIFTSIIFAYIYSLAIGIKLIPVYAIILDTILIVGIMVLSIINKNKYYFKNFIFFFITLIIGNSAYIFLKESFNENFSSTSSVLKNNLDELTPIISLIIIPIIAYLLSLTNASKNR